MQGISFLAEDLLASQEDFCFVELFSWLVGLGTVMNRNQSQNIETSVVLNFM